MRWSFAFRRTLTRLHRSTRGATAVEFALITPVFLLLVMGIIEFALVMFTMTVMESATSSTSRTGKTGWTAAGLNRQQTIISSINNRTAGLLNPNLITITTTIYPSFNNVNDPEPFVDANNSGGYNAGEAFTDINGNGQWDADMGAAGLGSAGDVVVYNISYPWTIHTPIVSALIGNPFIITVRSVVKNEPFNN